MKTKVFLIALVALLFSQSMQALQVIFINHNNDKDNVSSVTMHLYQAKLGNDFIDTSIDLTYGQSKKFTCDAIGSIVMQYNLSTDASRRLGRSFIKWVISPWVLENSYGIPREGDHTLIIQIEDSSGKISILLDNKRKVVLQAARFDYKALEDV